jgi:uncharacterized protein (TIGR00297 family)
MDRQCGGAAAFIGRRVDGPMNLVWGFLIALVIALVALRLGMLNRSGAAAAMGLGTVVFGLGGWEWSILLVAFFASSSGLTRLFGRRKQDLAAAFSKGGQRDAGQVLANGGLAGLAVLAHAVWPTNAMSWLAFAGALAAANADTWATELGVLSRSAPRLITTLRPVERGTSGGITWMGTLAALSGALLIALLGVLLWPGQALISLSGGVNLILPLGQILRALLAITLAGLTGSLVDSLLGATLQAIYYCPLCAKETERHPLHTCGTPTTLLRGVRWLDNDGVNWVCVAVGLVGAVLLS